MSALPALEQLRDIAKHLPEDEFFQWLSFMYSNTIIQLERHSLTAETKACLLRVGDEQLFYAFYRAYPKLWS